MTQGLDAIPDGIRARHVDLEGGVQNIGQMIGTRDLMLIQASRRHMAQAVILQRNIAVFGVPHDGKRPGEGRCRTRAGAGGPVR